MRHVPPPPTVEALMQAVWQAPLASAAKTSDRLSTLVRRPELSTRVAATYTQLQALPRRVRRALQRQWGLPLATLALWLALGLQPGLAATIAVGGSCTLVDALTAANTDRATGGCPAGSGADAIVLPVGSTQTLTEANNDTYGPTGLPVIQSMITIEGQGSTIRRADDAPPFRLVAVHRTGDLTLQETTVSRGVARDPGGGGRGAGVLNYGTLTMTDSTISGNTIVSNYSDGGRGAGAFNAGTLTVTDSTISGNDGGYNGRGAGVFNAGTLTVTHSTLSGNHAGYTLDGYGGGVFNTGTLTLTDSTLSGNFSYFSSGGVLNTGTLTVTHSTLSGNGSGFVGGGVLNDGTLTITNSTLSGNGSRFSGGVSNFGTLTVTDSTLSGNYADERGGGVSNFGTLTVTHSTLSGNVSGSAGGGVFNTGTLTVTDSTLSGNTSSISVGGGVLNSYSGTLTITNSTLSGNGAGIDGGGVGNAGTLILARTLISGNTADVGPEIVNESRGTVVADHHNLFGVDGRAGVEGFSPGATDVVPAAGVRLADILNPTLALHGGRTQTHALVPGSPAIDAGGLVCLDADGAPLRTDQRGQPRVVDGDGDGRAACDIGAFEFFPLVNDVVTLDPDLDTTFDPLPVPGGPAGTFTLTAMFTNTRDTPLRFPFFEVTGLSGGNLLLNADEGPAGVGATRTLEVGDRLLSPGEAVAVDFVIGLHAPVPFTVFVDLFGEPVP